MNPGTETPLSDRELRYLTVLWRHILVEGIDGWWCWECEGSAPTRLAVIHAPGCVFHGLDARTLAAISADWTPA